MRTSTLWIGLTIGLVGVAACSPAADDAPSVLLIVLDTVRADHMSLYGYERETTPRLTTRAEHAVVFDNAFSAAAWTLPGVSSILTGQYPSVHGAGLDGPTRMHDDVPTLAEILGRAGYATGAVANVSFLDAAFGLDRGFVDYDFDPAGDESGTRRADVSVDLALDWLALHRGQRSFFMLHLFDAHRHYDAPPPARGAFTARYADDYPPGSLDTLESRIEAERRGDLEFHVAAYDEEILWLDAQLDRLFTELGASGALDDTLVVLTADHGEAFREHHTIGHGSCLHNPVLRVPLVVWSPAGHSAGVGDPVSTVDIVPTILDLAGLPPIDGPGASLAGVLRGEPLPARALFAQNNFYATNLTTLIRWPMKLIQDHEHNLPMLYDLQTDPGELDDLARGDDPDIRRLINALRREARGYRRGGAGSAVEMSPEIAARLRALGYIQ